MAGKTLCLIPEEAALMTLLSRLILQIGMGIALAAAVVSVQATLAASPPVQHVRADVACQPIGDGMWRGGTPPQFLARPRVVHVTLTEPNMMPIMIGCGSAKRT